MFPWVARCPVDMVWVDGTCMDRFEAPNREGAFPLVMYSLPEATAWCEVRGKRLCYEDEWTRACAGERGWSYPYGDTHASGRCNDDKTWRAFEQSLLNGWPPGAASAEVESFDELLDRARSFSASSALAADHVEWLYQAEPSGFRTGCASDREVYDLCGNVEEWTVRRNESSPGFSGSLKGRYWADPRTCQSAVTVHADLFRFYEIGFRCCLSE